MSEQATTRAIPTPASLRRLVEKATMRGVAWPIERQARALAKRGRITPGEVYAFRAMAEGYLARPAFRAEKGTRTTAVRTTHTGALIRGSQVRGEWVERGTGTPTGTPTGTRTGTRTESVVLYVHGGAFIAFSPRTHRGLVSEIAARTGRSVFSVDYRLAPEHRFPAAADDVLRAYSWLLSTGVPADRIVVAGDSAGGHLALGLTPRAVRAGLPAPAAVVALSPVVDASMRWSLAAERRMRPGREPVSAECGVAAIGAYTAGSDLEDRELLLTADDLSVMPPTLLQVSTDEMLYDDAERYADALRAAGGQVELQTWPRKPHVFQVGFRVSRSASEAVDRIAAFVRAHTP